MKLPLGSKLFSTQDFAFINSKEKMITIRTYSLEDGVSNKSFIAGTVGALDSFGNIKFRTTGKTKEEALYACMDLLNDIEDLKVIFSKEIQQEIDLVG